MNKSTTIDGDDAYKACKGKTIAKITETRNSIDIHFTDKSFINIEVRSEGGGYGHGPDEYCYCDGPTVVMEPYFAVNKT